MLNIYYQNSHRNNLLSNRISNYLQEFLVIIFGDGSLVLYFYFCLHFLSEKCHFLVISKTNLFAFLFFLMIFPQLPFLSSLYSFSFRYSLLFPAFLRSHFDLKIFIAIVNIIIVNIITTIVIYHQDTLDSFNLYIRKR